MSTSKLMADKAWIDYQSVIFNFLDSIWLLKKKSQDAGDVFQRSKEILEHVKKPNYTWMIGSLIEYYGFEPDYQKISEIAEEIEKGKLKASEGKLQKMLKEAQTGNYYDLFYSGF